MTPTNSEKDELIEAQRQVIGILFEVVKRLQANNDLDSEYFEIVSSGQAGCSNHRLDEIEDKRRENARVAGRLLAQLDTGTHATS